jgi:hypothetical protein
VTQSRPGSAEAPLPGRDTADKMIAFDPRNMLQQPDPAEGRSPGLADSQSGMLAEDRSPLLFIPLGSLDIGRRSNDEEFPR